MTYRDSWAICTNCGERFVFRVEDQRRMDRQGKEITPPKYCPSCESEVEEEPDTWVKLGPGPHEGTVKWFDVKKGYGFIAHVTGEEIFFHRTGLAQGEDPEFEDGTQVTFLVEQTEKGPQAVDVARMEG